MPQRDDSILNMDADGLASYTGTGVLVLRISHKDILACNLASVLERLHIIADTPEAARRYRESLMFIVDGYDNDPRELQEIPEARAFFAALAQQWPHWLWFLARDMGAVALLVSMLCPIQVHRNDGQGVVGVEFTDIDALDACVRDLTLRGNAMFDAFQITDAEAEASIKSALRELFGGDA